MLSPPQEDLNESDAIIADLRRDIADLKKRLAATEKEAESAALPKAALLSMFQKIKKTLQQFAQNFQ